LAATASERWSDVITEMATMEIYRRYIYSLQLKTRPSNELIKTMQMHNNNVKGGKGIKQRKR